MPFPAQVAAVLNRQRALSGEYRIVLAGPPPYDVLPVEAELAEGVAGIRRPIGWPTRSRRRSSANSG